jgi:hypothetical protein
MDRRAANTLRILGIIVTVLFVLAACLASLYIALFILLKGGLAQRARITHPQAANSFFVAILLAVAFVTIGIIVIGRLATGIVRGRNASQVPATTPASAAAAPPIPSPASRTRQLHFSPAARTTIDRLVLALGGQIAVSAITMFQLASRPSVPRNWTLMLLPPFILSQVPDAILIYVLLKRPGRRAFTFLIAMLAFPVLRTLSNPLILMSYRQIYMDHPVGLLWPVLSGLIFVVILVLSYKTIQQTGLWPKPASAILVTVATFFYFFLVREITPYLYRLWG